MSGAATNTAAPDFALVNVGRQARLLVIESDSIRRVIQTGFARIDRHAWASDGQLAVLTRRARHGWREVCLLRTDGEQLHVTARLQTLIHCSDLAWFHGRLVVCGHSDTQPRAWIIDPAATNATWHPLPMPDGVLWERKGFDALVTRGERLIALDNIVFPKWMIHYRVDASGVLRLEGVSRLRANGSYEHVRSASAGDSRFAVLSSTIGAMGRHFHITLYDWQTSAAVTAVTLPVGHWQYAMQGDDLWVLGAATATTAGHAPIAALYRYRPGKPGEAIGLSAFGAGSGACAGIQLTRSRAHALYLANDACTLVNQPQRLASEAVASLRPVRPRSVMTDQDWLITKKE